MLSVARVVFFIFAALLILGGIAGLLKGSVISLIAGIVCGGLGLYAAFVLPTRPSLGLGLGLVGAIIALGGMIPRLHDKKTGEFVMWPAATVVAMSALTAVVAAAGLVTTRGATPTPSATTTNDR